MANTKSAKKAVKTNERRRVRNQSARSAVKTAFRKANESLKGTPTEAAQKNVVEASSLIDKAAVKGIVHKNTAARKKSRLAKKLNKATTAQA